MISNGIKILNIAFIKKIMRFYLNIIILFASLFLIFSCKKGENLFPTEKGTQLPNFGNVKLKEPLVRRRGNDAAVSVIEKYYHSVWEQGDLWGGILVAKDDEILFENYRGFAQDYLQKPIDAKTPLHVASVSKTLTAMAILKLVEAGKINLNDDVSKFFPNFPYQGITVKILLNQRSGLPKYEHFIEHIKPQPKELSKPFLSNQDILNILIKYQPKLDRMPNTGFMYCNTNYALLALIIEKITGVHFPEAMQQMVFRPLKMTNTYIFQEKDLETAAKSFYQSGPKVYPYNRLDLIYGDKNVYTTPRDLLNFSRAMYSDDFLKQELKVQIFQPYSNEKVGVNNYGLGFRMKLFDEGNRLTYHNGWWHGTNSVFAHLLNAKVTIIAIGNKYSPKVYSALALSALFENFPYEMEKLNKTLNPNGTQNTTHYEE